MNRDRFDTLSIPNYVIRKGPHRGVRHGNTERQRIFHDAHVAETKAGKEGCLSILDRFQRCAFYRESQIAIGSDEAFCTKYERISEEDHTHVFSTAEHRRLENSWTLQLDTQGPTRPMKLREDYAEAVRIKERFYREPGGTHERVHPSKQVRQRANQPFSRSSEGTERVDPKIGWTWYRSTTTSSSPSWLNSDLKTFLPSRGFVYSQWRFSVTDGRCGAHTAQNAACALTHT